MQIQRCYFGFCKTRNKVDQNWSFLAKCQIYLSLHPNCKHICLVRVLCIYIQFYIWGCLADLAVVCLFVVVMHCYHIPIAYRELLIQNKFQVKIYIVIHTFHFYNGKILLFEIISWGLFSVYYLLIFYVCLFVMLSILHLGFLFFFYFSEFW